MADAETVKLENWQGWVISFVEGIEVDFITTEAFNMAALLGSIFAGVLLLGSILIGVIKELAQDQPNFGRFAKNIGWSLLFISCYFGVWLLALQTLNLFTGILENYIGGVKDLFILYGTSLEEINKIREESGILDKLTSGFTQPAQLIFAGIYFITFLGLIAAYLLVKMLFALAVALAIIWGLIVLPLKPVVDLTKGWLQLIGLIFVWPLLDAIMLSFFSKMMTKGTNAVVEHIASNSSAGGMMGLHAIMSISNLMAIVIMALAVFFASRLISNKGLGEGIAAGVSLASSKAMELTKGAIDKPKEATQRAALGGINQAAAAYQGLKADNAAASQHSAATAAFASSGAQGAYAAGVEARKPTPQTLSQKLGMTSANMAAMKANAQSASSGTTQAPSSTTSASEETSLTTTTPTSNQPSKGNQIKGAMGNAISSPPKRDAMGVTMNPYDPKKHNSQVTAPKNATKGEHTPKALSSTAPQKTTATPSGTSKPAQSDNSKNTASGSVGENSVTPATSRGALGEARAPSKSEAPTTPTPALSDKQANTDASNSAKDKADSDSTNKSASRGALGESLAKPTAETNTPSTSKASSKKSEQAKPKLSRGAQRAKATGDWKEDLNDEQEAERKAQAKRAAIINLQKKRKKEGK